MDGTWYEDLTGRLYGLLIALDDRLGSEQVRLLHHFIEVGEYGLALEEISGALAQDQIAITEAEHGDMLVPGPPHENGRPGTRRARVLPRAS